MTTPITPAREHELAEALIAYTDPASPEYDPAFAARIRALRPDWFEDEHDCGEPGNEPGDDERN